MHATLQGWFCTDALWLSVVHPKLGLVPPVYMPCVIILVYNSSQGLCVEDLVLLWETVG